jgi:hypothetical protein
VDLYKAIRELVEERKRIDRIIASLEAMLAKGNIPGQGKDSVSPAKRRGRKSMGEDERKQVSERMSRYWAAKRAEKEDRTSSPSADAPQSSDSATTS